MTKDLAQCDGCGTVDHKDFLNDNGNCKNCQNNHNPLLALFKSFGEAYQFQTSKNL